jgi:hypothetical protein
MELADLTHDERLAMAALLNAVVGSDVAVSEGELATLGRVTAAFGDDAYRALATEADERFADEAALKSFLTTIDRQEARELIYGTVLEAALPEAIDRHESSLLGWLATAWNVTVQFEA